MYFNSNLLLRKSPIFDLAAGSFLILAPLFITFLAIGSSGTQLFSFNMAS